MSFDIARFLPNNEYQAAINSNNPSAVNPFATINDIGGVSTTIYNGDDALTGNRTVTMTGYFLNFVGGNIGINRSNPESQFEVAGMIRAISNPPPILTTGTGIEFYFNQSSNQGRLLAYNRDLSQYCDMVIGNGSSPNNVTVFASGNVGIGIEVETDSKLSVRAISNGTDKALVIRNNTDTYSLTEVRGNGTTIFGNNLSGTIDYGHTFKTDPLTYSGKLMQITSENSGADYYNFNAGSIIVSSVNTASGGFMNNVSRISFTATFTNSHISSRYDGDNALSFQNDNVVAGSSSSVYNNNENNGFRVYIRNGTSKYVGDTVMAAKSLARVQIGGNGSYASIPSTTAKVSIDGDNYTYALDVTGSIIVNGDIETIGNTNGLIVSDRTNGNRYRIYTDAGVLYTELVV